MPQLFGFLPQRRSSPKSAETEEGQPLNLDGNKDLPIDLSLLREQVSFKGEEPQQRRLKLWLPSGFLVKFALLVALILTFCSFLFPHGSGVLLARANYLGRQCFEAKPARFPSARRYRFAMVTCADGSSSVPGRSFEGLMDLVAPNKQSYVKRHGYDFIDASDTIDASRPPSWSKILAVRKHLPNYDWIFWNDADSVVTNPTIALEDIINSFVGEKEFNNMPDFIITEDVTGVNAGMFFVRNSTWSTEFLELWWNQTSFIRPFGETKSGDNDALKYLIQVMPKEEREKHVFIPGMQCIFNSIIWSSTLKNSLRLVTVTKAIWRGVYSQGDFMVHLAGLDDKKTWMNKILREIEGGNATEY